MGMELFNSFFSSKDPNMNEEVAVAPSTPERNDENLSHPPVTLNNIPSTAGTQSKVGLGRSYVSNNNSLSEFSSPLKTMIAANNNKLLQKSKIPSERVDVKEADIQESQEEGKSDKLMAESLAAMRIEQNLLQKELRTLREKSNVDKASFSSKIKQLMQQINKLKKHDQECNSKRIELTEYAFNSQLSIVTENFKKEILCKDKAISSLQREVDRFQEKRKNAKNEETIEIERIRSRLGKIVLFNVPLGPVLEEYLDSSTDIDFNVLFKKKNEKILSFSESSLDQYTTSVLSSLKELKNENMKGLSKINDNTKKCFECNSNFSNKLSEFASKLDDNKEEIVNFIDQKSKDLLDANEKSVKAIDDQIRNSNDGLLLKAYNKIHNLQSEKGKLIEEIEMKNQKFAKVNELLHDIENDNLKFFKKFDMTIEYLEERLKFLEGDFSKRITFETIHQKNPEKFTKEIYDYLEFPTIDNMNLIELQNIIKHFSLFFEVPLSKFFKKLPTICIYLRYERNLLHFFVDRLNYQIYNPSKKINFKSYTVDAYQQYLKNGNSFEDINHPLQKCLDDLYNEIILKL
ncbi:hypothetical protein KAFR_0F00150 [Kazachstania africana CBS 2517]|uniref:Uncharacterized protein n=1 Tax=Kazachstania africana (strain ATCC 22294 / BCRC 22015 / CBS 2517 / CECT 1963 / NBRC 1671 / NRRL Y-8276) TaxID=1071382 RepID=H2AW62_KAZAF|nr:hypothetical protein KAFR_0F00150 [Kazachstania africana CBS 2517]CCF58612.1 hypothetical protein KAFR_0F00150 [Kazachstania africana CBS 2517]